MHINAIKWKEGEWKRIEHPNESCLASKVQPMGCKEWNGQRNDLFCLSAIMTVITLNVQFKGHVSSAQIEAQSGTLDSERTEGGNT